MKESNLVWFYSGSRYSIYGWALKGLSPCLMSIKWDLVSPSCMQNMQRNAFKLMQNGLYMSFLQSKCATITRYDWCDILEGCFSYKLRTKKLGKHIIWWLISCPLTCIFFFFCKICMFLDYYQGLSHVSYDVWLGSLAQVLISRWK